MYLSFVCRQRTIRCVRVTFDGVVLQQYHTYQVDNIPICKFCNTKYTFSVFTRRWRIALENACSILTGKAELYVCGDPPNKNRDCHCLLHVESHAQIARIFIFIFPLLLLSSSTRRRFYSQRSSGQAVVTGVVHSTRGYVPSFLSHIGFSIPTTRRFSSNVANARFRAFR